MAEASWNQLCFLQNLLGPFGNKLSLKEIGDSLTVPISRSGVNHRFRKIAKIAEELRNGGDKDEQQ